MTSEAIVSLVLGKLSDLFREEARFLSGARDDMEWIQRELMSFQAFLKDADDAKHKGNARVRNWVRQIRGIAYDVEDIIDNFILGRAAEREDARGGFVASVIGYIPIPNNPITLRNVGVRIQEIKSKITALSSDKQILEIKVFNEGGGQEASSSSSRDLHQYRWNVALLESLDMVGMREDMMILKARLIDGDPKRRVVSIVGMGGSGKTTLARQVYSDVKERFDCHAFIYVSQQCKRREIWTSLIKSVMGLETEEIEKLDDQKLGEKLRCHLSGKRYLVVIDDIWSHDAWDTLKNILPDSLNQSRVMLTTRNRDVAAYADPSSPLEICLLKDDEAWELFLRKTFPGENAPIVCPEELEETGRNILTKCHGLPLAIVLLGGLLSRREAILGAWTIVLEDVTKRLAESSHSDALLLMEILALSYYDLPSDLKPCFLYFGLFPEDCEISSKRLIRMWIAEGFIKQEDSGGISEDRAENYLRELIDRSMIQVATKRTNGSVRTCRIHDLLRDLSIYEAKENNFFAIHADKNTNNGLSRVRRFALYCQTEVNEAINCPTATLRSMLCFSDSEIAFSKLFNSDVKFLRVLETGGKALPTKIPKNIGAFVNLRYLRLRGYAIKSLPSSIGKLSNLLTLELTFKGTLPNEIYKLGRLRHLYAYEYVISGEPQLHKLSHLQTLCLSAGGWIKDCLGELTNLRKLGIHGDLRAHHTALPISIGKLHSLRSLKLIRGNSIPQNMSFTRRSHPHIYKIFLEGRMEDLPRLPHTLTKLTLSKSELKQDAIDTLEKLPKLETLRLSPGSYCSESMICSSGGFCGLKFLKLDCSNLKDLIAEDYSMPSLKRVELLNEDNLRYLSERVRDLSR